MPDALEGELCGSGFMWSVSRQAHLRAGVQLNRVISGSKGSSASALLGPPVARRHCERGSARSCRSAIAVTEFRFWGGCATSMWSCSIGLGRMILAIEAKAGPYVYYSLRQRALDALIERVHGVPVVLLRCLWSAPWFRWEE